MVKEEYNFLVKVQNTLKSAKWLGPDEEIAGPENCSYTYFKSALPEFHQLAHQAAKLVDKLKEKSSAELLSIAEGFNLLSTQNKGADWDDPKKVGDIFANAVIHFRQNPFTAYTPPKNN